MTDSGIPDPVVVGAMAEEVRIWCEQHPGNTVDELMEFYRSKGWTDISYDNHCRRCGRPDGEHGDRPQDGPSYCGWTLAMVREHRANL